ncbi:unknown [Anaerotruncus sp. CAG:528]|nr:unknown [Anaerotruncus sp. CAG:528]
MSHIAVMPTGSMFTLFAQLPNQLLIMAEVHSLML